MEGGWVRCESLTHVYMHYLLIDFIGFQKKSREESEGHESGVEIIENRPYTDGPFGSGQYTYKVYYIYIIIIHC